MPSGTSELERATAVYSGKALEDERRRSSAVLPNHGQPVLRREVMKKHSHAIGGAAVVVTAMLLVGGCAGMDQTQRDTARGAGIGAAAGAAVGGIVGGSRESVATGAVIGAAGGAIAGNVWSRRMQAQKEEMEAATQGTGVVVTQTEDNQLKLHVPSDISFDTNRFDIKPDFRVILDQFATSLQANAGTRVTIIGHTDSTGTDAINNPLSVNRAASTRDYLVSRGVARDRISIDGRGSMQPIASNDNPAGRAQNRRVEILVAEPERVTR
jgi:outer membrane protein OmpA-like peptidoglycan-associated protein